MLRSNTVTCTNTTTDLLSGRYWLTGKLSESTCCPALDIARSVMQLCPIYILAHIIIGEALSSRLTRRPLRHLYFHRYSQMYRLLRKLLSDRRASIHRKMWALIQVAMVEGTVKRFDLQKLHMAAMDNLVESQGGIESCSVEKDEDAFAELSSRLYAGQLVRDPVLVTDGNYLTSIRTRFLRSMHSICRWAASLNTRLFAEHSIEPDSQQGRDDDLEQLSLYLDQLENQQLLAHTESACHQRGNEACISSLSLVLTFVECNLLPADARSFLASVQACLGRTPGSLSEEKRFHDIHPAVIAYNISCVRSRLFHDPRYRREMRISQAIADALKLTMYLNGQTITAIVTWLIEIIRDVSRFEFRGTRSQPNLLVPHDDYLQVLKQEIEETCQLHFRCE